MLCFYINASCRLIEQQKLCLVRNPSSKQQLLLIAAGQRFWHTFMSRNFDLHFADYLPEQLILRLILDKQLSLQVAVSHKHRFLYRLAEKQSAFAAIFADICNLLFERIHRIFRLIFLAKISQMYIAARLSSPYRPQD